MKRKEVKIYEASSKEYILALKQFPSFVKLINPINKPYKKLYDWFIENEKDILNENWILPSMKDIERTLKINNHKIAEHLKMIYDDIHLLNEKKPEKFITKGQIKCIMYFEYFQRYGIFTLGLNALPNVNDGFDFEFIKPKNGNSSYYVKQLGHKYTNSDHYVSIQLSYEFPNRYMDLLRDKAYLRHIISFDEYLMKRNETDEMVMKMYHQL